MMSKGASISLNPLMTLDMSFFEARIFVHGCGVATPSRRAIEEPPANSLCPGENMLVVCRSLEIFVYEKQSKLVQN